MLLRALQSVSTLVTTIDWRILATRSVPYSLTVSEIFAKAPLVFMTDANDRRSVIESL